MPLPKPPSKKGDLLQSADYEAQAAPRAEKRSLKTRAAEMPAQTALDLHDGAAAAITPVAGPALVPAAYARPPVAPAPKPRKPRASGPASSSCSTPTC